MNRQQKRMYQKNSKREKNFRTVNRNGINRTADTDFSVVPAETICRSIQLLINELHNRGIKIYDFDNKDRNIFQILIIRGRVYFLMEEEAGGIG